MIPEVFAMRTLIGMHKLFRQSLLFFTLILFAIGVERLFGMVSNDAMAICLTLYAGFCHLGVVNQFSNMANNLKRGE